MNMTWYTYNMPVAKQELWLWHSGEWLIQKSTWDAKYRLLTCGKEIATFWDIDEAKRYAEWREKGAE